MQRQRYAREVAAYRLFQAPYLYPPPVCCLAEGGHFTR